MDFARISEGMAVLCDATARVVRILHDPLGLFGEKDLGEPFTRLVARSSMSKALSFLAELRTREAAFDWELALRAGGEMTVLHFAGLIFDESMVIIASKDRTEVSDLYTGLMQINNEQMNTLRSMMKDQVVSSRGRVGQDTQVYEDFSRLNNELVNLQRELVRKNAELSRLNELKNRFLGMAAHDLRNPLAAIQMYSEVVIDELGDDLEPEFAGFLQIIHQSSQAMVYMVNDLLEISAIESGQLNLSLVPTDLVALIQQNVALNTYLAQRKAIGLEFSPDVELPLLLVDPYKIEQVLSNLISNAIKYSHAGTCVHVQVARANGEVVISVVDEGQGIPEAEMDRLFQYFSKTSVMATGGERSTGLGLAIVRRIVEGHHGRIWAESKVGQGSTFRVALPISEPAPDPQ